MFLKRLDVMGFKSFADKTNLDFSPGITSVVGPNGSGKSNIADAIRWVLGEQSAKTLRGAKMEDIIFAGSESRRPINYCEVSLTLDNTDRHLPVVFDEVTITRRVYRSGDSEYLLNNQACRLKDIHELFMDSGLGRESYSIIGQGKIEEMLSTRAEDRRGPFEDAAGIVKFKFRRKEAERKLDETEANLVRVDDILAELERQAGPLQEEAARARQFRELHTELTELDIRLLVHDIEQLKVKWQNAAAEVGRLSEHREKLAIELGTHEEKLARARSLFDEKNARMESLQRQLLEGTEERQRTEGNLSLLKERLENAERSLTDRKSAQEQVAQEVEELERLMAAEHERMTSIQARLEAKQVTLEVAANAVDPKVRTDLQSVISQLNADLIQAHHDSATYRNELKLAEESLMQDDRKNERLQIELDKWTNEVEGAKFQAESIRVEAQGLKETLIELQTSFEDAREEARRIGSEEAECVSNIHQLESRIASLKSRVELLKDLEEGYDGFALGVKTVLQAADKGRLQGIHGAIASIITVPKDYEVALETALGGALQNIVVSTEADARAAIQMLKSRQAGRATLMPMSVIKSRRLSQHELSRVTGVEGYVGIASDLTRYDSAYQGVVEHLLGNVIVAKSLLHANDLAKRLDYRVRIVTLEGDVVTPGGTMSGGSLNRKGPGLIGRARERQTVEEQLAVLLQERDGLVAKQRQLRDELTRLQKIGQDVTQQMETRRSQIGHMEASLREAQTRQQNAAERLETVQWEQGQIESGQSTWNERANVAREKLAQIEGDIQELEQTLEVKRKALDEWDRSVASNHEALTSLKVEVATLTQERVGADQRAMDLQGRLARLHERRVSVERDSREFTKLIADTSDAILRTDERLQQLSQSVNELGATLAQVRLLRGEAESDVVVAERNVREHLQVVAAADEQLHRAEVVSERTDIELNHTLNKLGETYHMTYEWAKEHHEPVQNVEDTKKATERLRKQMNVLGDVRIGAIEEWERLSERMNFLTRERTDLDEAKAQLLGVIQEIDEEMSRRFMVTFEQIRTEFQIAFRQLFGGGHADLELTAPHDVLNTGIEVIAQPPGKKLQNLNLMSGGERALTAMAMLFAILRVRPVPFCVLDEVEAALDEANVSRFASQLRRFSDETQFIVITHRRGTMEEADALYGVTMQESGVSSMISVRLSDDTDIEIA